MTECLVHKCMHLCGAFLDGYTKNKILKCSYPTKKKIFTKEIGDKQGIF